MFVVKISGDSKAEKDLTQAPCGQWSRSIQCGRHDKEHILCQELSGYDFHNRKQDCIIIRSLRFVSSAEIFQLLG